MIKTDISIQTLRGLAIILMVSNHVIAGSPEAGMGVADDTGWRYSNLLLEDFRMPLFTVISGYLYAARPVRKIAQFSDLVKGKARRLLVPLAVLVPTFFAVQHSTPGTNFQPQFSQVWTMYVYGFAHFWFLQAIFIVFLVTALLEIAGSLRNTRRWAVTLVISAFLSVFVRVPEAMNVFSLNGALQLLSFFLLGYWLKINDVEGTRRPAWSVFALLLPLYSLSAWITLSAIETPPTAGRALSLGISFTGIIFLFSIRHILQNQFMSRIGSFAFGIYLLHVFGTAGARISLGFIGVTSEAFVYAASMIAGIGLPIAFESFFGKYQVVSRAVLGQRPLPRGPVHSKTLSPHQSP